MKRLTSSRRRPARAPHLRLHSTALSFILCLTPAALAQDLDDVTITGRVSDERGAVVVGAKVTVIDGATRAERSVLTDGEGRYRLVELRPGAYTVRAGAEGFAFEERRGLSAVAAQNVRLDFTLRPAGVAGETVVVSASDAPPVDTSRTVVGGTLTRVEMEDLPLSTRSPLDLIFLLPGVSEEPLSTRGLAEDRDPSGRASRARHASTPEEAGAFALSGGPAYSNNVTVDGLDNNDDRAARERFQPSIEAVEEVQVITNQFSAEYGRASGGRVNIRTRGGSNRLRGRLFTFFKDESLNANSWNDNRRGLKRLPFQQHAPGFTLGGPVSLTRLPGPLDYDGRDRTFFFAAYEYDTTLDSTLIDALVPVQQNAAFPLPAPTSLAGRRREPSATAPNLPAELAPFVETVNTPSRAHALSARVDHRYTDAHNASFLLQTGRLRNLRQFGGGLRLADGLQGRTRDSDAISYTDNFVFSPSLVNQLRAQISTLRPAAIAGGSRRATPVVLITINDPLDDEDSADRSGTLVAGHSTSGASERRETRLQLQNALTVLRGAHTMKFGGDFQRVRSTFTDLSDATGTYNFSSAGDFLASSPSRFRQTFGAESAQTNLYFGLFAQDEWRVLPRLVLSYGLRYERETIIDDADNFAPRLAVAFDPAGDGKSVLRIGAGVFFNRVLLRTVDDFTLGRAVVEFDTNDLPVASRRDFIAANLRFPGALDAASPLVAQFGRSVSDFSRRLDPELKIPESYQFNAGFEREVGHKFVVEANYTFNRGAHLWREFNANAPRLPAGFADFNEYLLSRDFANFRGAAGARPVYNVQGAGDIVRFTNRAGDTLNPDAPTRVVEFGVPVTVFNLNSTNSTTALEAALAALQPLRPDPTRGQIEQLVSAGNSFYHGLRIEARRGHARLQKGGLGFSMRAAYTLSRLIDDGVVNTSSALRAGDFYGERARSLLDRRHRFVLSGTLDATRLLGRLRFSPVLRLASGAPFNVSLGGVDRNLDDVSNDRPVFTGDTSIIRWRRPNEPLNAALADAFRLPPIGSTGNLPRNAGRGPALLTFDLSVTREFRLNGNKRVRPVVEIDNLLNTTVFTFGAEFINFAALRQTATPEQRRAFVDGFLVPTRTLRPRNIRLGVRFDF
jgi:hypothetical protein